MTLFNNNNKRLKPYFKIVDKVNELEDSLVHLTDDGLRKKTQDLKKRLYNGETLDDILVDAFALIRETSKRVLNMRHYNVQIIGGAILHHGNIAEMKTGEGKTLVETLPAFLNALEGKGVHIVTVNDYLAKRDRMLMGPVFEFLGLSVGLIQNEMSAELRKHNYAQDITYVTNTELGFDYLRDNMATHKDEKVLRGFNYAIVDEVDSILIDEARTPLIITSLTEPSVDLYVKTNSFAKKIKHEYKVEDGGSQLERKLENKSEEITYDVLVDRKQRTANLTELGVSKAEKYFNVDNLGDIENLDLNHHISSALKANYLFLNNIDYLVRDGKVEIVDEHTGRVLSGRMYSDGLHQAIECKEGCEISPETKTLASITYQNFFKMYKKLSGMTGTAKTEEEEFMNIYKMLVLEVPTNKPIQRIDHNDVIYLAQDAKYKAIIEDIKNCYQIKRPVLVGTANIKVSEIISELLSKEGIEHQVLNAKYHEQESEIISKAGELGMITVATNMAGRGTDIIVCDEAKELGGLKVIGTERHDSRRIDNQLRGRAGRQGDNGESVFYLSFEDDLLSLFAAPKILRILKNVQGDEALPIEHKMITKGIENAQKKKEGINYEIRKHVVKYDEVVSKHRTIIYKERDDLIEGNSLELFKGIIESRLNKAIKPYLTFIKKGKSKVLEIPADNFYAVENEILNLIGLKINLSELKEVNLEEITKKSYEFFLNKSSKLEEQEVESIIRVHMLRVIDSIWISYIDEIDALKRELQFMTVAQKDPHIEFVRQSGELFELITEEIQTKIISAVLSIDFDFIYVQRNIEIQIKELMAQGNNLIVKVSELESVTLGELLEKRNSEDIELEFEYNSETNSTFAKLKK